MVPHLEHDWKQVFNKYFLNEWMNGPVLSDSKQIFWNALKDRKLGDLENQPKEKCKPIS